MQKTGILASLALSTVAIAQCTIAPPPQVLNTNPPDFSATHYMGNSNPLPAGFDGFSAVFDCQTDVPLSVNQVDFYLYDDAAVNPTQVGNTTTVDVYVQLGVSWTVNPSNMVLGTMPSPTNPPPGWIFLQTGTLTVNDSNNHSPCVFSSPLILPSGANSYAFQVHPPTSGTNPGPLHPLLVLPAVVPSTPLTAVDQFMNITHTTHQRNSWLILPSAYYTLNLEFHYDAPSTAAHSVEYGAGCYFRPQMFYEQFNAPTSFDLAGTSVTMLQQNSSQSYLVVPGSSNITDPTRPGSTAVQVSLLPPTTTTTTSWDDALITQNMGFAFPFAGGNTTTLSLGSNGVIWCGTSTFAYGYYSQLNQVRNELMPSISAAYGDWDLSLATGSEGLWYEEDVANGVAYITWLNVPEWVAANNAPHTNTFQVVLRATGDIEFHYGPTVSASGAEIFTGFCLGSGVQDSGSQDLSGTMPFQSGDGSVPSHQLLSARPVTGTSFDLVASNMAAGTLACFQLVGFQAVPGGLPLGGYGMPGCSLFVNPASIAATNLAFVSGGEARTTLNLPNNAGLIGVILQAQSGPLTPGLNAAGILTSSARCLVISNQ